MNFNSSSDSNTNFRLDRYQPPINFHVPPVVVNPRWLDVGMGAVLPPKPLLPLVIPPLDPNLTLQNQTNLFGLYSNLFGIGSPRTVPGISEQAESAVDFGRQEVGMLHQSTRRNVECTSVVHPTSETNPIIQQPTSMFRTIGYDGSSIGRLGPVIPGQYCKNYKRPCRVCLYTISKTFHYGSRVCDACSAFFRRSIRSGRQHICRNNDSCNDITRNHGRGYRKTCKSCRLKRCLELGMMPENVQKKTTILETFH